jgi:hypothetical protein
LNSAVAALHDSPLVLASVSYKQRVGDYLNHVKHLVANAQSELKANNNRRPSTEYSVQDIAFTVAQHFPSSVYPESVWKEDPVIRRRHISKVLRTTPVTVRPRVVAIRDNAIAWAKSSSLALGNIYITNTIESFDSLIRSAEDFVTAATDAEFADSLFLASGYVALDDAVNHFLVENKKQFTSTIHSINCGFNDLASLAGDLRTSLESIRHDAIENTKAIRHDLFATHIEHRLLHLSYHIRTELQNLSQDLHEIPEDDKEVSKVLRKHAANSLHADIKTLNDIKMTISRSKSYIDQAWENALDELIQGPTSVNYWVDMAVEVREAAISFGKSFTKKIQQNQQHKTCRCGHRL